MPSAPRAIGAFASQGSLAAIRTIGTHDVPAVAVIIACAEPRSIGPCSRSTMIQSMPDRAMICTVWMFGIVAIAPKVGRFSRHSLRRRLRGVGVAEVNCKSPLGGKGGGLAGLLDGCLRVQVVPRNDVDGETTA